MYRLLRILKEFLTTCDTCNKVSLVRREGIFLSEESLKEKKNMSKRPADAEGVTD